MERPSRQNSTKNAQLENLIIHYKKVFELEKKKILCKMNGLNNIYWFDGIQIMAGEIASLVVAEIIYKGIGNKSRAPYTLAILARPILARVNRTYVDQKRGRNCRLELKS